MSGPREIAAGYLKKAAQDEALLDAVLASETVSDEVIGFHIQQAAEKLLKAVLAAAEVRFGKTHDLRGLMDAAQDAGHPLPASLADLDSLTPYGTLYRYEDLDESPALDRKLWRSRIRELRGWAESRIQAVSRPPRGPDIAP